jgi:hypothetical protein
VSPSLSALVEEPPHSSHSDDHRQPNFNSVALSAFISDKTAETALKKGFRLSTFRIKVKNGTEYEYAIQNVNELLIPHKIEEIVRKKNLQNSIKSIENKGLRMTSNISTLPKLDKAEFVNWKQDPSKKDFSISFNGSIFFCFFLFGTT